MLSPERRPGFLTNLPDLTDELAAREAALLEAVWRGDELAAALAAVQSSLETLRARLARAEETVAELSEIGDAAQAAIDELRSRANEAEAGASLYFGQREAVAAALFQLAQAHEAEPAAASGQSRRGWWRRPLRTFSRWVSPRRR